LLYVAQLYRAAKMALTSEGWFTENCLEIKIIAGMERPRVQRVRFLRFRGFIFYSVVFRFVMPCVVT